MLYCGSQWYSGGNQKNHWSTTSTFQFNHWNCGKLYSEGNHPLIYHKYLSHLITYMLYCGSLLVKGTRKTTDLPQVPVTFNHIDVILCYHWREPEKPLIYHTLHMFTYRCYTVAVSWEGTRKTTDLHKYLTHLITMLYCGTVVLVGTRKTTDLKLPYTFNHKMLYCGSHWREPEKHYHKYLTHQSYIDVILWQSVPFTFNHI